MFQPEMLCVIYLYNSIYTYRVCLYIYILFLDHINIQRCYTHYKILAYRHLVVPCLTGASCLG